MKIYSVRDKLLEFFAPAFVAPGDKQVMQALANTVNQGKDTDAYKVAPHHFELWALAEIDEDGNCHSRKDYICDLSSLIRRDLRQDGVGGTTAGQGRAQPHTNGTERTSRHTATNARLQQEAPTGAHSAPDEGGS